MHLLGSLTKVPELLQACAGNNIADLRSLRLVSKEFGRIAMQALKKYTLTLKGLAGDTNISGAKLLKQAQLQGLDVSLYMSGM